MRRQPGDPRWVVRHAPGVTRYQHARGDLVHELTVFVTRVDPVKLSTLSVQNRGPRPRRLRVFAYAEWSLGPPRAGGEHRHVVTERDELRSAVLATNPYNQEFGGRVAFFASTVRPRSATGDRNEFLGRHGSTRRPAALEREALGGRFGAGVDPCTALEVELVIPPGETREVTFVLGQGRDRAQALALADRYTERARVTTARKDVETFWRDTLGTIQVKTPDDSFDVLMNGGSSIRRSARGCGRAADTISRAVRSASATSFRTSWRSASRRRRSGASTCCAPPSDNSSRATCSTGGIHRPGVARAHAAPTISCGSPTPLRATWP
jgi:cyclic beta-1,2-glucan synthetase